MVDKDMVGFFVFVFGVMALLFFWNVGWRVIEMMDRWQHTNAVDAQKRFDLLEKRTRVTENTLDDVCRRLHDNDEEIREVARDVERLKDGKGGEA